MKNFTFGHSALRSLVLGAVCVLASATSGWTAPGGFAGSAANAQGNAGAAVSSVTAGQAGAHSFSGGATTPGQHIGGVATGGRPVGGAASGGGPVASGNPAPVRQTNFGGSGLIGSEFRAGVGQRTVGTGYGQRIDGGLSGVIRPTRPAVVAQPNNAWSDPRGARIAPAARAGRYGYNGAYDGGQFYPHNRLPAGQYLHNGPAANAGQADTRWDRGQDGSRRYPSHRSYRYGRYFYGGLYYPYFYGAALPAYYGDFDSGYGASLGVDADAALTGDVSAGVNTDSQSDGYWARRSTEPQDDAGDDTGPALPPNAPAQVGPENPAASGAERRAPAQIGPDSLVEAVQAELAQRGYFAGKVDAIYGEPTREALRRFQADRKLAVTGRINEATLHALQLD